MSGCPCVRVFCFYVYPVSENDVTIGRTKVEQDVVVIEHYLVRQIVREEKREYYAR